MTTKIRKLISKLSLKAQVSNGVDRGIAQAHFAEARLSHPSLSDTGKLASITSGGRTHKRILSFGWSTFSTVLTSEMHGMPLLTVHTHLNFLEFRITGLESDLHLQGNQFNIALSGRRSVSSYLSFAYQGLQHFLSRMPLVSSHSHCTSLTLTLGTC